MISRQVAEGVQSQGVNERIAYIVDVSHWGSTPSGVSVQAFDVTAGNYTDVTATNLSGSASVAGNNITTPTVHSLTAGHMYRVEVLFVVSGNTLEAVIPIQAER